MKFPLASLTLLNTNYPASGSFPPLLPLSCFLPLIPFMSTCTPPPLSLLLCTFSSTDHLLAFPSSRQQIDVHMTHFTKVYIEPPPRLTPCSHSCALSAVEESTESLFCVWGFRRKASDQFDIFRPLVGKWHLVECSQHLSRWQTGGRMEDGIKDGEIKPLQPGDLCQRPLVCQQHYMQECQRRPRRRLSRPSLCLKTEAYCVCTRVHFVCVPLFISLHARRSFASSSIGIGERSKNWPGAPR